MAALVPPIGPARLCVSRLALVHPDVQLPRHGLIEEFLGLHNVVRATIPEHPEQNWWFMYFVLWPVSLLPWTGLTIYELIYGERNSWFKYLLTWGLGVFIFYNLMATKYITYTVLCIIPFIILTAQGYIRLKGHLLRNIPPREVKVIAMAPDSDFCWLPQQTKSYSKNLLVPITGLSLSGYRHHRCLAWQPHPTGCGFVTT